MLTFPRPLLCCCSCFRPPGTAPVQVCGSGLPLPSPLNTPSIGMCATYIVMRRGAHGRAYACTGVCMGLASRRRVRPGRVWWGFFPRVQEVSVRYVAFPFPSPGLGAVLFSTLVSCIQLSALRKRRADCCTSVFTKGTTVPRCCVHPPKHSPCTPW